MTGGTADVLLPVDRDRRRACAPFAAPALLGIVAGGMVAAATAAAPSEHGTWSAAYLVLVVGVAQLALGAGQALLAIEPPRRRLVYLQAGLWNAANAAVVAGTVIESNAAVYVGGAGLVVVLLGLAYTTRGRGGSREHETRGGRWLLPAYRALIFVLLLSIPVGLVLATLRNR